MNRPAICMMIMLLPLVSACSEPEMAQSLSVAATVAFTEGPTVAEDGTVYFTDIYNNRIMRLSTYSLLGRELHGSIHLHDESCRQDGATQAFYHSRYITQLFSWRQDRRTGS